MRKLSAILAALSLLAVLGGCRCRSGMMENPAPGDAGAPPVSPAAVAERWCRACALRSFLSCKRVDGTGTEEEIRRKARETACKDIGFSPQECTQEKIRFEECGIPGQ